MTNVTIHPEAKAEYDAALAWYRSRSPRAAARFEAEVDRVLGLAEIYPEMYPNYNDDHRYAVLRRFPYSVIYQVLPDQIYVVALAHSSRSTGYWLGRA